MLPLKLLKLHIIHARLEFKKLSFYGYVLVDIQLVTFLLSLLSNVGELYIDEKAQKMSHGFRSEYILYDKKSYHFTDIWVTNFDESISFLLSSKFFDLFEITLLLFYLSFSSKHVFLIKSAILA